MEQWLCSFKVKLVKTFYKAYHPLQVIFYRFFIGCIKFQP